MDREFIKKIKVARKSITVKSIGILILVSSVALLCMQFANYHYMNISERKTFENYQNSFELYCRYWDNRLELVNNALISLSSTKNLEMPYWYVCNTEDFDFETNKRLLYNKLAEIARNHQNEIMTFSFVPEKSVYIKSANRITDQNNRENLDQDIQTYIQGREFYNSSKWNIFQSGGESYFINVYYIYGGYLGAVINSDTFAASIEEDNVLVSAISTHDQKEELFLIDNDVKSEKKLADFIIPMQNLDYDFQIYISQSKIISDKQYFWGLSIITVFLGIFLLIGNIYFQMKFVLAPLNKLRRAMEEFSQGKLETRLEEDNSSNEVSALFRTFNSMTEQISCLKIEVYEKEIDRVTMHSNYLRVQIQPHFYTNILNLIYGLSKVKKFEPIQELALTTGAYFRYLLGEKGTFVRLKEEVNCVRNYIKIQQIRYKDSFEFKIECEEALENQMILPLVLQTFAENAVQHNITIVPILKIYISILREESKLHLTIKDNGAGFDAEILEKINQDIAMNYLGKHIGIQNVKMRLRMFYGEEAVVLIESEPGNTEIRVIIPEVISEEEKFEYYIS